jgi:hypothetical protein
MHLFYSDRADFIGVVGRVRDWTYTRTVKGAMAGAGNLPVYSINTLAAIPGVDLSDHQSYWSEGFRALMITDTAFYRNPHYHEAGDTHDKLDYRRMAQVVEAVFAVVRFYSSP